MPIALRYVPDVSFIKLLDAVPAVGTKHGYAYLAVDNVLPLVSGGMPVQLAQGSRIEIEHNTGDRLGNRKLRRIHTPLPSALENAMGWLDEQTVLVRLRRQLPALERRARLLGRDRPTGKIYLFFRELLKRRL